MSTSNTILPMSDEEYRVKLERWRVLRSELMGTALGRTISLWVEKSRTVTLRKLQLADDEARCQRLWMDMEEARGRSTPRVQRLDAEVRQLAAEMEAEGERRKEVGCDV